MSWKKSKKYKNPFHEKVAKSFYRNHYLPNRFKKPPKIDFSKYLNHVKAGIIEPQVKVTSYYTKKYKKCPKCKENRDYIFYRPDNEECLFCVITEKDMQILKDMYKDYGFLIPKTKSIAILKVYFYSRMIVQCAEEADNPKKFAFLITKKNFKLPLPMNKKSMLNITQLIIDEGIISMDEESVLVRHDAKHLLLDILC